ncbi:MAG: FtsX-like permease family protein [Bryobacterales bacterium]|nr:FtsX-like permease family protein [Bryobacterales bacterium]
MHSTALKIAWREARASTAKFLFVILAVALGVGALTGVRGFSEAFRGMLTRDARKLMAADMTVRSFSLATGEQVKAMDALPNIRRTWITETVSMLSTPTASVPVLVSIKAVDPEVYPFYGEFKLEPPQRLVETLDAGAIAVSDDLLVRLDLKLGDSVRLGSADFRIAATVAVEPDRMAGSLNVGPRILMSRAGLDRTGLMVEGSRASHRYLFRFDAGAMGVEQARGKLKDAFPEAQIIDYRETHPLITRGLDRSTKFLSLVSLIALIVGALGVAMAMHSHLQQKLDSIAVMKSLGARSGQIIRIYTIQTLILGTLGGGAGIVVGIAVQRIFPQLIARYFHLDPGFHWDPLSAVQGLAVGVLTTLLFTIPPLLSIRRVKPSLILRREMEETRPGWRDRIRHGKAAMAATALILAGVLGIVWWLSESLRTGLYFVGGFTVSLLILAGIAVGLLWGLKRFSRSAQQRMPAVVRHGIANIHRPGNQAAALLVALGLGVMFTLTVYLVQKSMLAQIASSAPPGMPNVFLINITAKERDGVAALLAGHPGMQNRPEVVPLTAARIVKINGAPIGDRQLKGFSRRFTQTRSVSWARELPPQSNIVEGKFWDASTKGAAICLSEDAAKTLPSKPGDTIEWIASGKSISARVVCIYRSDSVRIGSNFDFLFNPGSLDGLPTLHFAAVRMQPGQIAPLQRAVFSRFPTVTVINGADVLAIIQEVVDQIALVIRFISFFAILAGAIILASSVAGTRFRRVREVVILKTLGATRRRIGGIFSVEFLILGLAAGLLGSLLATGFSLLVLKRLFQVDYSFDPVPHAIAIGLTALLANAAGWAASHRILQQKPLEALRGSL